MTGVSLPPAMALAIGLVDINMRQPVERQSVQSAAERIMAGLSADESNSAVDAIEAGIESLDVLWSDEMKVSGYRNALLESRSLLHRCLQSQFDGIDMMVAALNPEGWTTGVADIVMRKAFPDGVIFRSSDLWCHVCLGLAAALEAADTWQEEQLYRSSRDDSLLEDHELKPKRDRPDQEMPWGVALSMKTFLEADPSADAVDIQGHLRARLRVELAERAQIEKRCAGFNRSIILELLGVDRSPDSSSVRRENLEDALEEYALPQRLDRLLITDVPETMLVELTRQFRSANSVGSTAELMAHLRAAMDRLQDLYDRLDALGNASRWGYTKSRKFIELADFDAAGDVVEEVRELAAKMQAAGTPFLPPQPYRPMFRRRVINVDIRTGKEVECSCDALLPRDIRMKRDVIDAALNGPPVRHARAAAEFGNLLTKRRNGISKGQYRKRIQLALGWWQSAMDYWTPSSDPRKWGVLACNIAGVHEVISGMDDDAEGLAHALVTLRTASKVLENAGEAWCHAAAYSAMLQVRSAMIRQGMDTKIISVDDETASAFE